jgi:hypothetical protein
LVITSRHKGHTVVLTWLCGSSPFHFEGITTITTYELRIIEEAIAQSLQGEWFNAARSEIDGVINDVRHHLKDRGIRIETGDSSSTVTVVFPPATSLTSAIKKTALSTAKTHKSKAEVELLNSRVPLPPPRAAVVVAGEPLVEDDGDYVSGYQPPMGEAAGRG